ARTPPAPALPGSAAPLGAAARRGAGSRNRVPDRRPGAVSGRRVRHGHRLDDAERQYLSHPRSALFAAGGGPG
nr:hypothetical protein [Tanacetum cinerariifolium]